MKKLPKRTQDLIDSFDDAAQDWGWQSDQGTEPTVSQSRERHEKIKTKLEQHVARLIMKAKNDGNIRTVRRR